MKFKKLVFSTGCQTGMRIESDTALACIVEGCSFEEGYAANAVGILFDVGFGQAWNITGCYFEGVRRGIVFSGFDMYGSIFNGNYFSSTEYAIQASTSSMRVCQWLGNSTPDEGGAIRNLQDFSPIGNDVFIQLPGISRNILTGHLTNVLTNSSSISSAPSSWKNDDNSIIAKALTSGLANSDSLCELPFEGKAINTITNKPAFVVWTFDATTVTIDTLLTYDSSNALVFNFEILDFNGTYKLHGRVFDLDVYRDDVVAKTITASDNGTLVRIVISGLDTQGGSIQVSGMIRHY